MFKAILIEKTAAGSAARLADLEEAQLPQGEVLIRVEFSTINYKDALAITGKGPVVRQFPMVAGIDLAGAVEASDSGDFKPGDRVVLNGQGAGELHFGGLAQRARVPARWLVRIPEPFSAKQAAAIGTAGFTAMLCVLALEKHGLTPGDGEVLVTGAGGGVGGVAVALLAGLGLKALGAAEVLDRASLSAPGKPLARERWAGVVDSVGSHTLANACAQTRYRGAVTACGLAQGRDFPASVAPFILRAITLYGIDSVMAPAALRREAWSRLARDLDARKLESMTRAISLGDSLGAAGELLAGRIRGRLVVDVNA
jgi:acrylyl-CoA reductase (NADPH)